MKATRVPTFDEVSAGKHLAQELRARYRIRGVLIAAAEAGYIYELRCAMPHCFAETRDHFEPLGLPLGPWMPTHEHFPIAKRFKGTRVVTNAVLAHRRCNNVGYKIEELREYLQGLRLPDDSVIHPDAIAAAMNDHVEQRAAGQGRYPRSRGSRKRAVRIAIDKHNTL